MRKVLETILFQELGGGGGEPKESFSEDFDFKLKRPLYKETDVFDVLGCFLHPDTADKEEADQS